MYRLSTVVPISKLVLPYHVNDGVEIRIEGNLSIYKAKFHENC